MNRIKEGDTVQVITGNEIGARGDVESVVYGWYTDKKTARRTRNPNKDKLIIRGVNVRKKHQKQTGQTRTQTGIIDVELPIHISNVMLVCPSCNEVVRVRFSTEDDEKVRVCKRCEKVIG